MQDQSTNETRARQAAITVLAVIGFLALVFIGIVLAIYAARYVPQAVSGLFGTGASENELSVVPSLPFPPGVTTSTPATSTAPLATSTSAIATSSAATSTNAAAGSGDYPVYYRTTVTDYPTPGSTKIQVPVTYSGLPNLTVTIIAVGYMDGNGNFVAASTISHSQEFAAQILVTNTGTNKTGDWTIQTTVPTSINGNYTYTEAMPSLEPNQSLPLTLALTRGSPETGTDTMQVTVDVNNAVAESNESDNIANATYTVN